jgi:transcriptional regulator with XRE-family HTH domain
MKQKEVSVGERIRAIRGNMSQAEFGELLHSSQGAVSAWERDDKERSPSAAIYLRLAALARTSDDSVFFLEQAGLEPDAIISVADLLLKKGEVKMDEILATADDLLNKRTGQAKKEADKGTVVLVPRFPEGASTEEQPALAVPAVFVPNRASVYYIVAPSNPIDITRRGFGPGDFIFFDASVAGTGEILEGLAGDEVLVRLTPSGPHSHGEGLFIGRPGFIPETRDQPIPHMGLWPSDRNPSSWTAEPHQALAYIGSSWRRHAIHRYREEHIDRRRAWYEFSECEVLGKVIARFSAGTVDLWKRQAAKK